MTTNDEHTPLIAQDAPQSRTARAAKVAIATLAIAGACATAANVTPKAGARASLGDASAQLGSPAIKTPKAITTHSEANMAIAKDVAAALGYKTALVLPTGAAPMVQYHLHLGCEDALVKERSGNFWTSPVVEARLVYHNYEENDFFTWERGIVMAKTNIYPGDSQTWFVDTNVPDWEYGFGLKNARGEVLYEIGDNTMDVHGAPKGTPQTVAPLFQQQNCTNMYGMHHNRIATIDVMNSERPGYVDSTFGSCRKDCVLKGDPWDWSAADKERMTTVMASNPPVGLGSSFMMYGTNDPGVCTLNLMAKAGCGIAQDDIVLHADPRPNQGIMIFDFLTCGQWTSDYSGWRTKQWGDLKELGPSAENVKGQKWKFTYFYTAAGLKVQLESGTTAKRDLFVAPWLSSNPYDRVRSIGTAFNPSFHVHGGWNTMCQLAPIFSPRVVRPRVPL